MRVFGFLLLSILSFQLQAITKDEMISHIETVGENIVIDGNAVNFTFRGIPEILVFDENSNRMRLISPIIKVNMVDDGTLLNALEANFHSVLDARYAVGNDIVWSAFIHPLDDLSLTLFDSAIQQVAIAHATFGQEFTSGALVYPGNVQ